MEQLDNRQENECFAISLFSAVSGNQSRPIYFILYKTQYNSKYALPCIPHRLVYQIIISLPLYYRGELGDLDLFLLKRLYPGRSLI